MNAVTLQHKAAWEFDAYAFWLKQNGPPEALAEKISANPLASLKKYAPYFENCSGLSIANICGSCGKKAVPLALLGANVTVFDLSEENARYARELAAAASVPLTYEVGDVMAIDMEKFGKKFDIVFMEGGVLHYFHDLPAFMQQMHVRLRPGGQLVCSDFHPFTKVFDSLGLQQPVHSYFDSNVFEGEMAHARFYPPEIREKFPKCQYRKYTLSEILNSVLHTGFTLTRFDEHPAWNDPALPGEFTLLAQKNGG